MSSGLYSGQPGLSLGTGLYRTVSGLWSGASGLAMAFGGAGMPLSLNFLTMTAYTLDPRITFSRGSQATLTDSTGKLTYAPNNLLTNSESFEASSWTKTNATVTANTVAAPDGTTTADTITTTTTNGQHTVESASVVIVGITYVASVYVKANGSRYFTITNQGSALYGACFDLQTGTLAITAGANVTATSITSVGDGWYRVSVTSAFGFGKISFAINNSASNGFVNYAGDGTSGIYLWGAQLEAVTYQTTPSPYVSTTPKNLLGYTQEFDNAAWTKSNAFVQTNLLTYSEQFDNAVWTNVVSGTGVAATATANVGTAPDGTLTADRLQFSLGGGTTTADYSRRKQDYNTPASTYTFSVYLRSFDGSSTYNMHLVGPNGLTTNIVVTGTWQRFTVTGVGPGVTIQYAIGLRGGQTPANSNTADVLAWGAQLVQGDTPGNYQRTTAAPAAVMYSAPDGSITADKLVENTANSSHIVDATIAVLSGTIYASSIYAKAGERTSFSFRANNDNSAATFNLANGTVGVATNATASITAVGGGWYRCTLIWTATSSASVIALRVRLLDASGNSSYTGDGTSGIYIWGAQLSNSASVDPYVYNPVAAPSSTAYYGPRFDYDPVTLAPCGLLIEEQRTNLLLRSEEFDNASWGKDGVTLIANAVIAPNGTLTAYKVIPNTVSTLDHRLRQNQPTSAVSTSMSVYVKAAEYSKFGLREGNFTGAYATFNLATGVVIASGAGGTGFIQSVGNGWYRCSLSFTASVSARVDLTPLPAAYTSGSPLYTYAGDGVSGIFVWGAQLEASSLATSYIPTGASTVTRSADVALMQGANFSNWYNQSEGTLYVEGNSANGTWAAAVLGPSTNIIRTGKGVADIFTAGSNVFSASGTSSAAFKAAIAYASGSQAAFNNGAQIGSTGTTTNLPTGIIELRLNSGVGNYLNGHIRSISYYNTRLPNQQLQALTS